MLHAHACRLLPNYKIEYITKKGEKQSIIITSICFHIIYKPIFYRVQELDSIKLEESLTQNIGINMVNYMTKSNTFKLLLNDNTYIESSRSSIYVIFRINASELSESYGRYHILNEDDEYISSGSWRIV